MLKENVWIYVQQFEMTFCGLDSDVRKSRQIELHTWQV